nr:uncharacterized protein LOC111424996 isoform X1 [Onthophagus taurus]
MSMNFTAYQFDEEYKASRLRNWEIPRWHPERPCGHKGKTRVVSNEKGHLLPGVPRSYTSPWGNFVGTWDLPKKISRELAFRLSAPPLDKIQKWRKHCERSHCPPPPIPEITSRSKKSKETEAKLEALKRQKALEEKKRQREAALGVKQEPVKEEVPKSEEKRDIKTCPCHPAEEKVEVLVVTDGEIVEEAPPEIEEMDTVFESNSPRINKHKYIPGQLTDFKYRHPSHQELVLEIFDEHIKENPAKGYPKYREDFLSPPIDKPINSKQAVDEFMKEMSRINKTERINETASKEKLKKISPYLAAAKNFVFAKKLHKENLEHKPLPDTVTDAMYRKAQMMGGEPGLMLKDGNFATGVGWKGYPGYGATRCTKLKVYRPKTCENFPQNKRPNTANSFDKKWRFIRRQKVTPIELAICWDMTPINPHDEPKRTVHIDGSNGSQAPAIFTSVHTPKENIEIIQNKDCNCSQNLNFKTLQRNERPKTVYDFRRHKSTPDLKSTSTFSCSSSCPSCLRMKELRPNGRLCVACELKNIKPNYTKKTEFKMAFKAGVPNNNKINVSVTNKEKKLKIFQVKRPPDPYKKTGYTITSLAPPFSFQTGKRHEYPDHWRLASVYQHSYKPVHARKRSLLATVFL